MADVRKKNLENGPQLIRVIDPSSNEKSKKYGPKNRIKTKSGHNSKSVAYYFRVWKPNIRSILGEIGALIWRTNPVGFGRAIRKSKWTPFRNYLEWFNFPQRQPQGRMGREHCKSSAIIVIRTGVRFWELGIRLRDPNCTIVLVTDNSKLDFKKYFEAGILLILDREIESWYCPGRFLKQKVLSRFVSPGRVRIFHDQIRFWGDFNTPPYLNCGVPFRDAERIIWTAKIYWPFGLCSFPLRRIRIHIYLDPIAKKTEVKDCLATENRNENPLWLPHFVRRSKCRYVGRVWV